MLEGIDVSYYQRITDWSAIAQAKKFAIVRSGDGSWLDNQMLQFARDAYLAGCAVDIYHYIRLGLTPQMQAATIIPRWQQVCSYLPARTLWLDWEDVGNSFQAMSVQQRKDWMLTLVTLPEIASIPGGDYTGKWWVDEYLGGSWPEGWPKNRKRWIGQYGPWSGFFKSDPTAAGFQPALFPGWPDWDIWQYSSSGVTPGIANLVDLDVAKEEDMAADPAIIRRVELLEEAAKADALHHQWTGNMGEAAERFNWKTYINAIQKWRLEQNGVTFPADW